MTIRAVVFDAYGTLFDVDAAARAAAAEGAPEGFARAWEEISRNWRLKQLQYSWLRAVMGEHADFWQVTCDALDWALEAAGMATDRELRERLLALYRELAAYREVPSVLARLRALGVKTAILSNGSPGMLADAVRSAGIEALLDAVLSVEEVGVFKPARQVYALVERHLAVAPDGVLFVSSNGWDAAAGSWFGFHTAWVDRAGQPMDRLPWKPQHVLPDLSGIPALVEARR